MAVGLFEPSDLYPIKGIKLSTTAAGIRYQNRDDLLLISINEGARVAAVFTQNKFCAAPVVLAKEHISKSAPRALLVNSGNANAGTGSLGASNAEKCCQLIADKLSIKKTQVLPFSTGVIGEQLPMQVFEFGVEQLSSHGEEDNWLAAAKCIMTTDTLAKGFSEKIDIDGHSITITGIVKGSGMICPNMATLLSYVATDAAIDDDVLKQMLERATEASFNRITVDSDTSTNDSLVLIATGTSDLAEINSIDSTHGKILYKTIKRIFVNLAKSVIRDAEGASKFVNIEVMHGESKSDCETIAYSVAHSPLVKTALFACDPNWGRILMAVGKSDVDNLDVKKISIKINNLLIVENGEPAKSYTEELGKVEFEKTDLTISVDLNDGSEQYHVWTSDLSHEYVTINADYRS